MYGLRFWLTQKLLQMTENNNVSVQMSVQYWEENVEKHILFDKYI